MEQRVGRRAVLHGFVRDGVRRDDGALTYGTGAAASGPVAVLFARTGRLHHVVTNKHFGYWKPQFEAFLGQHGLRLKDMPVVRVIGHAGPHPWQYHRAVLARLERAGQGLSGEAAKQAILAEASRIARECQRRGSQLNRWITTPVSVPDSYPFCSPSAMKKFYDLVSDGVSESPQSARWVCTGAEVNRDSVVGMEEPYRRGVVLDARSRSRSSPCVPASSQTWT